MTDPLSDILDLLTATTQVSAGFTAGGDWSVRTPSHPGLKFNAVMRGTAWLSVEDEPGPIELLPGDCFVLTTGRAFILATDLTLPPTDARVIFSDAIDGMARAGEGETFLVHGGRMDLDPVDGELLLGALPPVILIKASSAHAARLQWLLGQLRAEVETPSPGSRAVVRGLMHLMFIEGLRAGLASAGGNITGWAGALADPRLGAVLKAIHAQPERSWRHAELAAVAGMSPSAFATRFKAGIGTSPLNYQLQWRMRLAARALRTRGDSLTAIALSLGYGSDSAFSNSFRRVVGIAPGLYRTRFSPAQFRPNLVMTQSGMARSTDSRAN